MRCSRRGRVPRAWLAALAAVLAAASAPGQEPPPRTLRDIPLHDLRTMLKGYRGDWRPDTGQARGLPEPPRRKPVPGDARRIALPPPAKAWPAADLPLRTALEARRSRRTFGPGNLSAGELGMLLWSAQGVTVPAAPPVPALRTAPSGGARYPLETYACVLRVDGVPAGVYRYLPDAHQLVAVDATDGLAGRLVEACYGQAFVGTAAAVVAWAAVPGRTEWAYGYLAHRMIAMEAGHAAQNLCLASTAAGAAACTLLSYDQGLLDEVLGIDGENEFTLYLAVVGKAAE